jgi:hypothetical protein
LNKNAGDLISFSSVQFRLQGLQSHIVRRHLTATFFFESSFAASPDVLTTNLTIASACFLSFPSFETRRIEGVGLREPMQVDSDASFERGN